MVRCLKCLSSDVLVFTYRLVRRGAVYAPSVHDHAEPPFCLLKRDAHLQHEIYDDHGHLIPPWEMHNELRPGSVMLVLVAICERNTTSESEVNDYYHRVSALIYC